MLKRRTERAARCASGSQPRPIHHNSREENPPMENGPKKLYSIMPLIPTSHTNSTLNISLFGTGDL